MKTVGIIAEYNPFHSGHRYHIEESKKRAGADFCVAVMSGDFVQRGAPALIDKYTRTRMALTCGADLVIELPSLFAVSSAEDFASCGVSLLDRLGCITFLSFGSETGKLAPLLSLARLLLDEPAAYREKLKEGLSNGESWPRARSTAVAALLNDPAPCALLENPNNLLAIEYLKALLRLNSPIEPLIIRRSGNPYHSTQLDTGQASATALRETLLQTKKEAERFFPDAISAHVPSQLLPFFKEGHFLCANDFSAMLNYRLLTLLNDTSADCAGDNPFLAYADVSRMLANRLKKNALVFSSWDERVLSLKTRQYTYTRVSRALTHILLGFTKTHILKGRKDGYAPYARILGFRKSALPLLSALKKTSQIPLITKTADARDILSAGAWELFSLDLHASHIRQAAEAATYGTRPKNEYTQPVTIL